MSAFNYIKSLLDDPAQTHYLVDSNFRTVAQGWARADGTGPLDLWAARNPGYVYRTGDYATDPEAWNAARDSMVDFRGDVLFLTPGAYTLTASTTWDVPYARILGQKRETTNRFGCSPAVRNTTITTSVAAGALVLGADADGVEMGYIRWVPTTAQNCILVNAAADALHFHDFMWDAVGVATSAATTFMGWTTVAQQYHSYDHFTWLVDAAQGPVFNIDIGASFIDIGHFLNICALTVGTYVTSLADYSADGIDGVLVHDGRGFISVAGAGAVTQLLNGAAQTGTSVISLMDFYAGVGYASATTLIAGTAGDADLSRCFLSTTEGGTGETLITS